MNEILIEQEFDPIESKIKDLDIPGAIITFTPEEADQMGAFEEDALSENDALESYIDLDI